MTEDTKIRLRKQYPFFDRLFAIKPVYGCAIGNGWTQLFENMLEKIQKEGKPSKTFRLLQIKEKFGTLRIYSENGNKFTGELISLAEKESEETCEICGSKDLVENKATKTGWWKTLCDKCRTESEKEK